MPRRSQHLRRLGRSLHPRPRRQSHRRSRRRRAARQNRRSRSPALESKHDRHRLPRRRARFRPARHNIMPPIDRGIGRNRRPACRSENPPPQIQPAAIPRRRNRRHAPPVPLRRQRISAQRQTLPPARHSGTLHGHRPRPRVLRPHRAGTHRPDPQQPPHRPPGDS